MLTVEILPSPIVGFFFDEGGTARVEGFLLVLQPFLPCREPGQFPRSSSTEQNFGIDRVRMTFVRELETSPPECEGIRRPAPVWSALLPCPSASAPVGPPPSEAWPRDARGRSLACDTRSGVVLSKNRISHALRSSSKSFLSSVNVCFLPRHAYFSLCF